MSGPGCTRAALVDVRLRPADQQVHSAALADGLHSGRPADSRQEARQWVLPTDGVASGPQEAIPRAVVDGLAGFVMFGEYADRNLLETSPPQALVQTVEAKLRIQAQDLGEANQGLLVSLRLRSGVVSESLQSLSTFTLLGDARGQRSVLGLHGVVEADVEASLEHLGDPKLQIGRSSHALYA